MWLGLGILLALGVSACTSQGECTYDTDCPQVGYVCEKSTHKCTVSTRYNEILLGRCATDLDCDPVMARCENGVCKPRYQSEGTDPDDGDAGERPPPAGCEPKQPTGGACAADADCTPVVDGFVCDTETGFCIPDCSRPGTRGQGRDRDLDGWGDCCDCLDDTSHPRSAQVNPGATEIVYNNLDDDCNPATTDCDLDGDGFCSVLVGGDDCDDRNPNAFPGNPEICDLVDNNCNGQIDELPECNQQTDRPNNEQGETCPDLGGTYNIKSFCMQISDQQGVELNQNGCNISFFLDTIGCTGRIDSQMNFYVECAGIGIPCSARASLTSSFVVNCSSMCSFIFERVDSGTTCTFHTDPDCTTAGKLCGVVVDNNALATQCVDLNPGARQPGYYCDEQRGVLCLNSLCVNRACGAICQDQFHCTDFTGTACRNEPYSLIVAGNPPTTVSGSISTCTPEFSGETICRRTSDCAPDRVCSYRQTDNSVRTVCRTPNPSGGQPGDVCTSNADCANNLCLCGTAPCPTGQSGFCSAMCVSTADCAQGAVCSSVSIPDLGGAPRTVQACTRDPGSCGRHADCPVGKACIVFMTTDRLGLETDCSNPGNPGYDNTGATCGNDAACFSLWCNKNYCLSVCLTDNDCPTLPSTTSCTGDADCPLGYLCNAANPRMCERDFGCMTQVFYMGNDLQGNPVYTTLNMCLPERRACLVNADCRAAEACMLFNNRTATAATYQCDAGGPGTGQLGADCTAGYSVCWTGLCLVEGQGGPGKEYCSQACNTDADCEPVANYSCQAIRVDVRPGYVSYVPACARRPGTP
jgi:hypothetical protein